jgi:O-antigen ligase
LDKYTSIRGSFLIVVFTLLAVCVFVGASDASWLAVIATDFIFLSRQIEKTSNGTRLSSFTRRRLD